MCTIFLPCAQNRLTLPCGAHNVIGDVRSVWSSDLNILFMMIFLPDFWSESLCQAFLHMMFQHFYLQSFQIMQNLLVLSHGLSDKLFVFYLAQSNLTLWSELVLEGEQPLKLLNQYFTICSSCRVMALYTCVKTNCLSKN